MAVGVLVTGLFAIVRPLTFPLSCLAALLVTVALVVLSPDNHVGSRLMSGAMMTGGLVLGVTLGGVVLTLAWLAAPSHCTSLVGCGPHTAALCCLGVLVLAALVAGRAALGPPHPPHLWVAGMCSVLCFGLTLIGGQLVDDLHTMWRKVVGGLLMSGFLSHGVCCLVSVLVLPSLAVDEMRGDTAAAIRGIGHAASSLASRALLPHPNAQKQPRKHQPGRMSAPAGRHAQRHGHGRLGGRTAAQLGESLTGRVPSADPADPAGLPAAPTPRPLSHSQSVQQQPTRVVPGVSTGPSLERWEPTVSRESITPDDEDGRARQPDSNPLAPLCTDGASAPMLDAAESSRPLHRASSTSSLGTSCYTSDEEGMPPLRRHTTNPRVVPRDEEGMFDLVLEDEDDFLRLLQEATAPHLPPSRKSAEAKGLPRSVAAAARLPPRPVAPPGGILPSPSVQNLQTVSSASHKRKPKSGSVLVAAKPVAAVVAATSDGDGAHMPGAGPATAHGGGLAGGAVAWAPVSALRPLLGRARVCLAAAGVEPHWMMRGPVDLRAWSRVLVACGMLLDRVSALECLAEDTRLGQHHGPTGHSGSGGTVGHSVLGDSRLEDLLGADVLGPYRRVYGEVAAGCAAMAAAVEDSYAGKGGRTGSAGQAAYRALGGWAASRLALRDHIREAMARYWARVRAAAESLPAPAASSAAADSGEACSAPAEGAGGERARLIRHHRHYRQRSLRSTRIPMISLQQGRAVTFLWTVTEGVLGAMDELEAAVREALLGGGQAAGGAHTQPATAATGDAAPPGGSAPAEAAGSCGGCTDSHGRSSLSDRGAAVIIRKRVGACCAALRREVNVALPLLKLTLGIPLMQCLPGIIASNLRALLTGGPAGRSALLAHRNLQFGAKYFASSAAMLCLILGLAARPELGVMRQYSMMYPFMATCISMTERVESTLSRAALRSGGTTLGGLFSFAIMVHPPLARNGPAVLAIVCALTFTAGCQFGHRLLYGFTLALLTLQSLVLCLHHTNCCDVPRDTAELVYVRIVSVVIGCTVPVLATQMVLPWFTSDWALERMAAACKGAATVVRQVYGRYYHEHLRAHVSSRGLRATSELLRRYGHEAEAAQMEEEARAAEEAPRGKEAAEAEAGQGTEPSASLAGALSSGGAGRAAASAAAVSAALQALVCGPLVAVQTSLMKDVAVWTRGIFATPKIVSSVLRCCLLLSERLTALALVVSDTPPPVEGRLSGWAFGAMVLPLHRELEATLDAIDHVAAATARLLDPAATAASAVRARKPASTPGDHPKACDIEAPGGGDTKAVSASSLASASSASASPVVPPPPPPPGDALSELQAAISELDMRRLQVRQHVHDMRRTYHAAVRQVDERDVLHATHPDDIIRVSSMMYAMVKVMDKLTAAARTTLEYRRRRRSRSARG